MLGYILRRLLFMIPTLIGVTFLVFSLVALSPGGQNPLIKAIIEHFCPAFAPGGVVLYIGDTENKFVHLEKEGLEPIPIGVIGAVSLNTDSAEEPERTRST